MAPTRRQLSHRWLERYPGLYVRSRDGMFYVRHPVTRKQGSLQTADRHTAIRRWAILQQMWEQERPDFDTEKMADNLSVASPIEEACRITLQAYLHTWRTKYLGHQLEKGRVSWDDCNVFSQRGRNRGRPIAMATRIDYASDCQQLEKNKESAFLLSDPQLLRRIRRLLSAWLTKPTHYNGLRNTLSRIFSQAVQDGLIDRNPMPDIQKISEPKREVLIPDETYKEITARLCTHKINRRAMDGTWRAKICDMVYMMSQQPIDVFGLEEDQIKDNKGEYGEIHFARHKTGVPIVLEMNADLRELVEWFREWKRTQQIISPYLMVYPRYLDFRSRTKPVKHRFIQQSWAQACEDAGYKGQYQLRDLRKKGLTDEFLSQGENNKGGHETEAMRKHYRLIRPPERSKSTLKSLRDDEKT